jgi:hypothetical protein
MTEILMSKEERLMQVAGDLLEKWRVAMAVVLLDITEIQLEFITDRDADIALAEPSDSRIISVKRDISEIF